MTSSFVDVPAADLQRVLYTNFEVAGWSDMNVPLAWRMDGTVDRSTVLAAVDAAFRRHEALRTTLVEKGPDLFQRIWPFEPPPVAEVSLRNASCMDDDAAYAAVAAEINAPFDIARRLCRVSLFRAGEDDQLLLFVMHHAIADGWSCMVLDTELCAALTARRGEAPAPLAPAAQMRDYVELEQADDATRHAEYWRPRIAPTTLRHRPRLEESSGAPNSRYFKFMNSAPVAADVAPRLDEIAAEARATRAMTVLAALTGAYSPYVVDALRIGVVHANRFPPRLQGAVGQIAMLLPLRVAMTDELTFRELLAIIRRESLDMLAHRVRPAVFGHLTRAPGLGRGVMFDAMVNVLPSVSYPPAAEPDPTEMRVRQYDVPWLLRRMHHYGERPSPLPELTAYANRDGRLGVLAHANETVMPHAALAVLCAHVVRSIERLVRTPDRPIRETLEGRPAVPGLDVELASSPVGASVSA
jgi:hypothetical protein